MKNLEARRYQFTAYQNVFFVAGPNPYGRALPISSECYLNLIETAPHHYVAIVTELHDNPGMSVDNAAEFVAEQIVNEFGLNPMSVSIVTRYTDTESYRDKHSWNTDPDRTERLALVVCSWQEIDGYWFAKNAQFSHITRARLGLE